MDTLCIPVGLGKTLRRKAIARMNFTFAGADNVLVIDPALRDITARNLSKLQLRLHVACSPWMTRCWTFQEARLARAWHVYLRSVLYTPGKNYYYETSPFLRIRENRNLWTDEMELEKEAIAFHGKMWPLVDEDPNYRPPVFGSNEGGDVKELTKIWTQLNERSTTRPGDRLVILAVLLDLNAGEIMALKAEEQMKAIFRTQNVLPLSLLFEPSVGPTADDQKCQWIPAYPKGGISTAYGCMTRNKGKGHYQFVLSDIKALGFLLDAKYYNVDDFHFNQIQPYVFGARVKIIPKAGSRTQKTSRTSCIILSRMKKISSDRNNPYVGARFLIEEIDAEGKAYTLIYDCPLTYTLVGPKEASPSSDDCPKVEASVISESAQVSLDCGMCSNRVSKGLKLTSIL